MQRQPTIHSTWLWSVIAAALGAVVYGLSVAPGLVGGDSPELVVAGVTLGIPHQPGYPLYTLLGRLAALIAPGNPTLAMNAASALAAAGAVGLSVGLAQRWGAPGPVACLVVVFAALGWPVWAQAVVAEVYALGLLLAIAFLSAVDRWLITGDRRWAYLAAYVGGLAVSHQPLNVMLVVGALAAAVVSPQRQSLRGSTVAMVAALFAWPFTVFVYLPIRSAAHPPIDYAQIQSVGDFFYHALGVASRSEFMSEGAAGVGRTASIYLGLLVKGGGWLTPILSLAGIAGVVQLARSNRPRAILVGVSVLSIVAFSFVYAILDVENYAIIPWWLLVLASAPAWGRVSASRRGRVAVVACLAVAVIGAFVANRSRCDRSSYRLVDDFVANVSAATPERGALFLLTETLFTPFLHQQVVRKERTDLRLVDMTGKVARQDLGFRGLGGDWQENRWRRVERLRAAPPADLADRRWRTLMFQPRPSPDPRVAYRRSGLLTAIVLRDEHRNDDPVRAWSALEIHLPHHKLVAADRTGFSLTPTILRLYADLAMRAAESQLSRGSVTQAERTLRLGLDLAPRSAEMRSRLASIYLDTDRADLAEAELRAALAKSDNDPAILCALGVVILTRGDATEAEAMFRQSVERAPDLGVARANLGFLLARDPTRLRDAAEHLSRFVDLAPDDPSVPAARQIMARAPR